MELGIWQTLPIALGNWEAQSFNRCLESRCPRRRFPVSSCLRRRCPRELSSQDQVRSWCRGWFHAELSLQTCASPQATYHDHYAEDLICVAVRPLTKLVFLIGDHINYHLSHHFNRKTSYSKVLQEKVCHPRFMPDRRCHQVGCISEDSISL